ncbi:MAG: calmodulin-binding protein [Thermoguttaceae bacterium]
MVRKLSGMCLGLLALVVVWSATDICAQEMGSQQMSQTYNVQDWNRFYHYPYVYYPQNYWSRDYYRSSNNLYDRYPAEMQVPVYNKAWHNFYPQQQRRYYSGNHFRLDIF